jgi:uncharacterized protein
MASQKTNLDYLIIAGVITLAAGALFLAIATYEKVSYPSSASSVTLDGEGRVSATPDVALAELSILTEGDTSKAAQDENSKKSKSLTDYLKSQGIDEKDIKTTGYNIYPQYYYPSTDRPRISGYQVNQSVQVKIRDLSKMSSIMDGVVQAGVNQVNNLSMNIDDPNALMAQAREKAIANAKEKAQKLKSNLGIKLGRIISFSESNYGGVPPMYYNARAEGMGAGGGSPSLPVGQNEIVVNVSLTYQIR